ncbi:MAG TPA: PAS domain-containing protein [Bacteroidales bacterium]|nr:PAS domain-containing protein [Bacteroidales bacterium]
MKLKFSSLKSGFILIIIFFILIILGGIYFILRNLSASIIYQQISLIIPVLIIWSVILYAIYRIFLSYIIDPVRKIEKSLGLITKGDLSFVSEIVRKDELGRIARYVNRLIINQSGLASFLEKIGDGKFNTEYRILSEKDKLGYAISGMKDKLQKLVSEDAKRQWTSEGVAKFGAILRENSDDLKILGDNLISELCRYINANQGAIFLLEEETADKRKLELISAYAWGRKKYITQTIEIGEGLVGQAAIERDTVFLTDVPDSFVRITSGLGDSNPRCILIVPLLFNDELFGVIEFASFKVYEAFEIQFVEKLAEIVASTISRTTINKQTQKLLKDSQKLTEELRTQEEEMRQNLEEMNATQEEMQQREVERIGIFSAINNTIATVEFNMEGNIITANDKFLSMLNYSLEDIENKPDRIFADKSNEPIEVYNKFWEDLRIGIAQHGDFKRITSDGRELWVSASYTPAFDKSGKPYKVIELAQDISDKKRNELELHRQAEEMRVQGEKLRNYTAELEDIKLNLSEKLSEASKGLLKKIQDIETEKKKNIAVLEGCVDGVISFNQSGTIEYFNHSAEEIWGMERENVLGKNISSILNTTIQIKDNNLTVFYSNNGTEKEIQVRTEISFNDLNGNPTDLLATLTRAKIDEEFTFTIFAQKISVDFF